MFFKKEKIITHNGSFHADEVLAVATIFLALNGRIKVIRTRDPEIIKTGDYVVDVGGIYDPDKNKFDHHQEGGAGKRENGIPYSSFGLVWKKFGEKVCGSKAVAEVIDKKLGEPIDANDNGIDTDGSRSSFANATIYTLPGIIKALRPIGGDMIDFDEPFHEAVKLTMTILKKEIERTTASVEAERFVRDAYQNAADKRIVIFQKYLPAGDLLSTEYTEPLFVIYPGLEGKWYIRAVKKSPYSFEAKKPFPQGWSGKRDEELAMASGVSDALYCHHSGQYIATAKSKEGAVALAKLAVEN